VILQGGGMKRMKGKEEEEKPNPKKGLRMMSYLSVTLVTMYFTIFP
jgi:hypothetical protein